MRKFQESRDVVDSIEDIQKFWDAVDDNHDGSLDKDEFAELVLNFSTVANVELHAFIDFMVVQSTLKNNSDVEAAYIQNMKTLKEHKSTGHEGLSDDEDEDRFEKKNKKLTGKNLLKSKLGEYLDDHAPADQKSTAAENQSLAFLRGQFGGQQQQSGAGGNESEESKDHVHVMDSNMDNYNVPPTLGERTQNLGRSIANYFRR